MFWVFVVGGIPTVAGLVLGHLVRSVGKTKEAGIGLTIGGVMNIIVDPIFIFVFGMQVAGAAVATMLSNVISMLYFFVVLAKIRKTSVITLSPKHFTLAKKVSLGTLSVGFPAAISVLLVSVSISLLNGLLLSHEGGNILSAAYGVTSKCGTIALHISIGIAQGVMPLIGYGYGAKDHKRVHAVCRLSFLILLFFSVIFLAIVQLIPDAIVRMLIDHAETIAVGSVFMRCWSWCVIGMSLFNMYNSIFQAVGKWKTSLFLAVLRLGVIFTALCFILNAWFGVTGLMWVQAITDTLSCLIAVVLYERFKKSIAAEPTQDTQAAKECQSTSNRVIAISREFGSGGRTIGKEVAIKLAISCCDSDLIEIISMKTGLTKEYVEKNEDYAQSASFYDNAMSVREQDGQSLSDKMWLAQKKVVTDLAKKRFLRNCWALCRLYFAGYCGLHDRVYPCLRREKGRAHCYCIRRKRGISRAATA